MNFKLYENAITLGIDLDKKVVSDLDGLLVRMRGDLPMDEWNAIISAKAEVAMKALDREMALDAKTISIRLGVSYAEYEALLTLAGEAQLGIPALIHNFVKQAIDKEKPNEQ